MTKQNKTYIEPGDVIGICFTCKKCGAALSLPVSAQMSFSRVANCPNCGEPWTAMMQSNLQPAFDKCAKAISELVMILKHYESLLSGAGFKGASLSLELSEKADRAVSGKD